LSFFNNHLQITEYSATSFYIISVLNLSLYTFRTTHFSSQWAFTLSLEDVCFQDHILSVLLFKMLVIFPLNQKYKTLIHILGCFPLDYVPYHTLSDFLSEKFIIRSLHNISKTLIPLYHIVLYHFIFFKRNSTWIDFAENQLFQVWLAFHPYSQFFTIFCYIYVFSLLKFLFYQLDHK